MSIALLVVIRDQSEKTLTSQTICFNDPQSASDAKDVIERQYQISTLTVRITVLHGVEA